MTFDVSYRPPVGGGAAELEGVTFLSTFNPTADGETDDRAVLLQAAESAIAAGHAELVIEPGRYACHGALQIIGARGLHIRGNNATIVYSSDDESIAANGSALSSVEARSGILLAYCSDVIVQGLTFEGGTHHSTLVNIGPGVYGRHCVNLSVVHCKQVNGCSILQQDSATATSGTGSSLVASGGNVTLNTTGTNRGHAGRYVTITGASNRHNNGVFRIRSATSSTLVFANPVGATEVSSFAWKIDDEDRGTWVAKCWSERARGVMTIGSNSVVSDCHFEQPLTTDVLGIGDSFSISGSTVTLTDHVATWHAGHVGRYVVVQGATSGGNNGTFLITAVQPATANTQGYIQYTNASGATEACVRTTTSWWIPGGDRVGIGAGASALAKSGTTMTLTASVASFAASDVGKCLHINGATSNGNNVIFEITQYVSPTQVRFENSSGTAESYSGVWQIDSYDALTDAGSTHAIYIFAGRENIQVLNTTFVGIRRTCVKASGSAFPIRNIRVQGCYSKECANFVTAGADDAQDHRNIEILDNLIDDCATGRVGWLGQIAIDILGARNVTVRGNKLHYSRLAISGVDRFHTVAGNHAIRTSRYLRGYSQPIENVVVEDNHVTCDPKTTYPDRLMSTAIEAEGVGMLSKWGSGGTFTKSGNTMTLSAPGAFLFTRDDIGKEIRIAFSPDAGNNGTFTITAVPSSTSCSFTNASGVGGGVTAGTSAVRHARPHPATNAGTSGYCRFVGNTVNAVGSIAFYMESCINLQFVNNTWGGVGTGLQTVACAHPVIVNPQEAGGASISIHLDDGTAWPIIERTNNAAAELAGSVARRSPFTIADVNGSICDYPLLGRSGRARPSDGYEESVIPFGGDLVDGDTIIVLGTTCVYKGTAPGAGQFNTYAGLVALLEAAGALTCADYGTGLSGGDVATQHMRVRRSVVSTTDNNMYVYIDVCNPNALVTLRNYVAGSVAQTGGRGSASDGPVPDKTVIWTPCTALHTTAQLIPANSAARLLLATGSYQENKNSLDAGCCAVMQHNETTGTEEFRWVIS